MYFIFGKWSTEQNDIYYFEHKLPVVGGEGGGGSLNNVLYGRLRLDVQSLTVLYIPFYTEKAYTL